MNNKIKYIGVNDHKIDLFESQFIVKNGMAYNSYLIIDEKTAVMDSVEANFKDEWFNNVKSILKEKDPDYLVVQHMEPDHSANILNFMNEFKTTTIVSTDKSFQMMKNFFSTDFSNRRIVVKEGDTLSLGEMNLKFIMAPMIHWPEVMMTYEASSKTLFSADAFGKFGALDVDEPWDDEARRYYFGIVGKYGFQVQTLFKKIKDIEINTICSLHGPILENDLSHYLSLYNTWSSYTAEKNGVVICYSSIYGNTKKAVQLLSDKLKEKGVTVHEYDLSRCDWSLALSKAFEYDKLILATTTYNMDIFPKMREFIHHLTLRQYQNRTIGFIENGSWAPQALRLMKELITPCKNINYLENNIHLLSSLNDNNINEMDLMVQELIK